jgi:hypothetical protein
MDGNKTLAQSKKDMKISFESSLVEKMNLSGFPMVGMGGGKANSMNCFQQSTIFETYFNSRTCQLRSKAAAGQL